MLFDVFKSREVIKGNIVALKPIHIGVGEDSIDPVQVDSPVLKDSRGLPVIPGSSLKGVLRSRLEAILANPAFEGKWRSCNILDDSRNCYEKISKDGNVKAIKEEIRKSGDNTQKRYRDYAEKIYSMSCDVCKLFGNGHIAAKLQIKDMLCVDTEVNYERRDGVGMDRDTGTASRGAKYGFQIVPAGIRFEFYMIAENLEDEQKKLVELLIKILEEGDISIGGMTSRGLGQIKLIDTDRKNIDAGTIFKHYNLEC
ncbi:type III CRISPR-associated RAMP protein Csx7 [Acetivibrio cellulolyticus]|uniref:type III CRISPR-associated RAMP protein Csx7 n=1 Tax=Acetivibrio cellulolyticus TaxID=35830 RepID=UPI0001E2FC0A|nr:CRISPR-associated RAMP protein Csx7 [Acetivibrio cellulolyticus]